MHASACVADSFWMMTLTDFLKLNEATLDFTFPDDNLLIIKSLDIQHASVAWLALIIGNLDLRSEVILEHTWVWQFLDNNSWTFKVSA